MIYSSKENDIQKIEEIIKQFYSTIFDKKSLKNIEIQKIM